MSALFAVLLSAYAAFAAADAPNPNMMTMTYGDKKIGEVDMRDSGSGGFDAAFEEVLSQLGFKDVRTTTQGIVVRYKGKKLELWNNSNVVRLGGGIISLPDNLDFSGGHWWIDAPTAASIADRLFAAAGENTGVKLISNRPPVVSPDKPARRRRHRRRYAD